METLKQSLKIAAGLAAVVAVVVALSPERPSLLAGDGIELRAEAPVPQATAQAAREPAPVEVAQAPAPAAGNDDGLTPGQRHLERLRATSPSAPPAVPAEQTEPAREEPVPPAEEPVAAPPAEEPPLGGGAGLDSLTQPAGRPQFRIFRTAVPADSGTIEADGQRIRLAGLVPVPLDARCADGSACGEAAREALREWLAGREILCAVTAGAEDAPCVRDEDDVGEWVVANGWAEADARSRYGEAQERAQAAGLGIWGAGGL